MEKLQVNFTSFMKETVNISHTILVLTHIFKQFSKMEGVNQSKNSSTENQIFCLHSEHSQ